MDEPLERCDNCKKDLPQSKMATHFGYCKRNVKKCAQCGLMYDINFQEEHQEQFHKKDKCAFCNKEFLHSDISMHKETCTLKPKFCQYCQQNVPVSDFNAHFKICESRTQNCQKCRKAVTNKDYLIHITTCQGPQPQQVPIKPVQQVIQRQPRQQPRKQQYRQQLRQQQPYQYKYNNAPKPSRQQVVVPNKGYNQHIAKQRQKININKNQYQKNEPISNITGGTNAAVRISDKYKLSGPNSRDQKKIPSSKYVQQRKQEKPYDNSKQYNYEPNNPKVYNKDNVAKQSYQQNYKNIGTKQPTNKYEANKYELNKYEQANKYEPNKYGSNKYGSRQGSNKQIEPSNKPYVNSKNYNEPNYQKKPTNQQRYVKKPVNSNKQIKKQEPQIHKNYNKPKYDNNQFQHQYYDEWNSNSQQISRSQPPRNQVIDQDEEIQKAIMNSMGIYDKNVLPHEFANMEMDASFYRDLQMQQAYEQQIKASKNKRR